MEKNKETVIIPDVTIPEFFNRKIEELEKVVGVCLRNRKLWVIAFKHRSYLNVTHESRIYSNERLEFLGDSVVNLTVTHFLFQTYLDKDEGILSKWKSILVSKDVFSFIAIELNLGKFLLLNKGEEKSGGRERVSILADVYEAVVGAIFLDQGFEAAKKFIGKTLLENHTEYLHYDSLKNYKSILLEYSQKYGMELPVYNVIKEEGPDHDKLFYIQVEINSKKYGLGKGKNKKNAEQKAAADSLIILKQQQE